MPTFNSTRTFFLSCIVIALCHIACGSSEDNQPEESPAVSLTITTPQPAVPLAGGGTVVGTVRLTGSAPAPVFYTPNKDTEICGTEERAGEELLLGPDMEITNVVVSVVDPPISIPMNLTVEGMMDQKGCVFTPHLVRVAAGAPMIFLNNDNMLHNVHTVSAKNPSINKAQPGFMKKMTEVFSQAEPIRVQCDVHTWMSGWIVVQDHPFYAVTDVRGMFTLEHVPAGVHTLRFWHETLGEQTVEVTVKEGETTRADLVFAPPVSP
jgi:plastocyanin